jgi:putative membrane protein
MTRTRGFAARAASWLVVAAVPLCIVGCQNEGRSDNAPGTNVTPTDKSGQTASNQQSAAKLDDATKTNILLRQIHANNQAEIDLGKIAEDRAQNPDVKKFANEMVTDHTQADQKLTDLAKRMNIDINMSPTDPVQKALSSSTDECKRSLRGQSGAQFDVSYSAPQVDDHVFTLKLVEEGEKTASGDVKKLLEEMRPTVESHLEHARALQRALIFSAAVGGGPMGHETAGSAPGAGKQDGGYHESNPRGTRNPMDTNRPMGNSPSNR